MELTTEGFTFPGTNGIVYKCALYRGEPWLFQQRENEWVQICVLTKSEIEAAHKQSIWGLKK